MVGRTTLDKVDGGEAATAPNSSAASQQYKHTRYDSNASSVSNSSGSGLGGERHHVVVPAYPYNVSMSPFIPGSSSTRSESYFEQHVPDDSNVQTRLPAICVDYLSHDWTEDDVWTSWKAMTKHKSEIANGVRLENASWRTWAKQRGKLKTISPETLNWLKDSDVTWLYGPLHTAVEPVPAPKAATAEDYLGLDQSLGQSAIVGAGSSGSNDPLRSKSGTSELHRASSTGRRQATPKSQSHLAQHLHGRGLIKPILKHRSLSDILSVPSSGAASPVVESPAVSDDEDQDKRSSHGIAHEKDADMSDHDDSRSEDNEAMSTAHVEGTDVIMQSASSRKDAIRSHRKERTSSHESHSSAGDDNGADDANSANFHRHDASGQSASSSRSPTRRPSSRRTVSHEHHQSYHRSSHGSHAAPPLPKKRHIVFNHCVEQCISIDVDDDFASTGRQFQHQSGGARSSVSAAISTQNTSKNRYIAGGSANSSGLGTGTGTAGSNSTGSSSDDDDDEEEVLTFRSSSPRSPNSMKPFLSPSDPNAKFFSGYIRSRDAEHSALTGLHDKLEPHTIAKLAPTTLKETDLLPGPTPIVLLEDGRIKALYGTEDTYVYDAEEHLGLECAPSATDSDMIHVDLKSLAADSNRNESALDVSDMPTGENDDADVSESQSSAFYNAGPARSRLPPHSTELVTPKVILQQASVEPSYDNVATPSHSSHNLHNVGDASPVVFDAAAPASTTSSTAISPNMSPGQSIDGISQSASLQGRGSGPTKSILKRRDPASASANDEYYPPIPPASTRASRAHATMFADDDDNDVSPYSSSAAVSRSGEALAAASNKQGSNPVASNIDEPQVEQEPSRGRSTSRGSSSSLIDRASTGGTASLNGSEYNHCKVRSGSGGHSLSPVPSLSPPREPRSATSADDSFRRGRAPRSGNHGALSEEVVVGKASTSKLDAADTDIQLDVVNGPTIASASTGQASASQVDGSISGSDMSTPPRTGFEQRSTSFAANVGRGYAGRLSRSAGDATTGTGREGASSSAANIQSVLTVPNSPTRSSTRLSEVSDPASTASTPTQYGDLPSPARESLLRTLSPDQPPHNSNRSVPSSSGSRSAGRQPQPRQHISMLDDDVRPETTAMEYAYGFDLSDDEEVTSRSVVSRAAGMFSSLWRAGSSVLWADHSSSLQKPISQTGPGE